MVWLLLATPKLVSEPTAVATWLKGEVFVPPVGSRTLAEASGHWQVPFGLHSSFLFYCSKLDTIMAPYILKITRTKNKNSRFDTL